MNPIRLLFFFLLMSCATGSFASHYAAADLYVDYIGSGPTNLKYKVTLTIYKACEPGGIDLNSYETVAVQSANANVQLSRFIYYSSYPYSDTLDQLCPNLSSVNSCRVLGSIWPGYVRRSYIDTITVPTAATDWKFIFTNGSRNAGTLNLDQPGSQQIWVEAMINNVNLYSRSTPRYPTNPIPYLCLNQPNYFLNLPIQINGNDSLVTTNLNPMGVNGSDLAYANGFSLNAPVPTTTGYVVNPTNGGALFTPTMMGKFAVAFRTNAYNRNTKALVSYVSRDMQYSVLTCNMAVPTVSSVPGNIVGGTLQADSSINVYDGGHVSFDVAANTVSGNTLSMVTDVATAIPAATFTQTINATNSITGHFDWQTVTADIGLHHFQIKVQDSSCNNAQPMIVIVNNNMKINVLPLPVSVGNAVMNEIAVYPTPANEWIYVDAHGAAISKIIIYDMTGKVVARQNYSGNAISVKMLPAGVYQMKMIGAGGVVVRRFLKE